MSTWGDAFRWAFLAWAIVALIPACIFATGRATDLLYALRKREDRRSTDLVPLPNTDDNCGE